MQQIGKLRPGGVWGPARGPAGGLPKTGRGGSGLGDSLCPHPVPLLGTPRLELEARLDTAQCYANPGQGARGGDTPSSRKPCPKPWVGGLPRGTGAWALLTFVEESCAGASLGLAQCQHFCDHLGQTAGQLGVKGQRGG